MALTNTWLKANHKKERAKPTEVTDQDGLSVRVSPTGRLTFQLRYRYAKKQKRIDIGTFPHTSLREARQEALKLKGIVERGDDPAAIKRQEQQRARATPTIEEAYRIWHEAYCIQRKRQAKELLRTFELHLFPELGDRLVTEATQKEWMDLLEGIAEKQPSTGKRLLNNGKQMYKWLKRRQYVEANPLDGLTSYDDLHVKDGETTRVLSRDEIRYLYWALNGSRIMEKNKVFMRLCLFFGCRNGELRLSRPEHFDLDRGVWTVPVENHKTGATTGRPLYRPIIDEVKPLILHAMSLTQAETVFANWDTGSPMGRSATLRMPYGIRNWLHKRGHEMPHWSMHDLRRTARTNFSDLAPPHVAEVMLGHTLPGRVYDHYDYLDEQADAYREWWHRLEQIEEESRSM